MQKEYFNQKIEINIYEYEKIIFDCDGVIFDSNHLKNNIFHGVLTSKKIKEDLIHLFIEFHKKNGGVSRYKKFEYLEKNLLGPNFKGIANELLELFSGAVVNMYLNKANLVNGFIKFIEFLDKQKDLDCFIVSGSDEKELNDVFRKKKLSKFFKQIFGSPKDKFQIIDDNFLNEKNNKKILFFGDSKLDFEVAKKFNFDFIFVDFNSDFPPKKLGENNLKIIKDFNQIKY